jgi:hypothetical protein
LEAATVHAMPDTGERCGVGLSHPVFDGDFDLTTVSVKHRAAQFWHSISKEHVRHVSRPQQARAHIQVLSVSR